MKYCSKCGNQINENAVICPKCGCIIDNSIINHKSSPSKNIGGLKIAAGIFMIIRAILSGLALIPLFAYLPVLAYYGGYSYGFGLTLVLLIDVPLIITQIAMTIVYWRRVNDREPIGLGFKICSLLFVSLVGGILMLCDRD